MLPLGRWMSDYEINRCMPLYSCLNDFCVYYDEVQIANVCLHDHIYSALSVHTMKQKQKKKKIKTLTHTHSPWAAILLFWLERTQSYVNGSGVLRVVSCCFYHFKWVLCKLMSMQTHNDMGRATLMCIRSQNISVDLNFKLCARTLFFRLFHLYTYYAVRLPCDAWI